MSSRQDAYGMIQAALNATAMQKYPSSHTFLMGFLQGAALAIDCGARYPHLLAGYIRISGRIKNVPGLKELPDIRKWILRCMGQN